MNINESWHDDAPTVVQFIVSVYILAFDTGYRQFSYRLYPYQGRIFLSRSSQCETSVMRVRLEGLKTYYKYALAHYEYALGRSDAYSHFR